MKRRKSLGALEAYKKTYTEDVYKHNIKNSIRIAKSNWVNIKYATNVVVLYINKNHKLSMIIGRRGGITTKNIPNSEDYKFSVYANNEGKYDKKVKYKGDKHFKLFYRNIKRVYIKLDAKDIALYTKSGCSSYVEYSKKLKIWMSLKQPQMENILALSSLTPKQMKKLMKWLR